MRKTFNLGLSAVNSITQANSGQKIKPEIVYTRTLAKKVLFNSDKTATGVQVETAGIPFILTATKEVISCAGAFNSPQLLMVSGVGLSATLRRHNIPIISDLPGVGENMLDQIFFGLSYHVNVVSDGSLNIASIAQAAYDAYSINHTNIYTAIGSAHLGWENLPSTFRTNLSSAAESDLATFPTDWPEIEYLSLRAALSAVEDPTLNYGSLGVALLTPTSRGTVIINSSDKSDLAIVSPSWLYTSTDQEFMVAAFRRLRYILSQSSLPPVLLSPAVNGPNVDID